MGINGCAWKIGVHLYISIRELRTWLQMLNDNKAKDEDDISSLSYSCCLVDITDIQSYPSFNSHFDEHDYFSGDFALILRSLALVKDNIARWSCWNRSGSFTSARDLMMGERMSNFDYLHLHIHVVSNQFFCLFICPHSLIFPMFCLNCPERRWLDSFFF